MEDILKFLSEHWVWLSVVLASVLAVAGALVKLTTNTIDDWVVGLLKQGLAMLDPYIEDKLREREEAGSDASEALPGTGESLLEAEPEDADPSDLRLR